MHLRPPPRALARLALLVRARARSAACRLGPAHLERPLSPAPASGALAPPGAPAPLPSLRTSRLPRLASGVVVLEVEGERCRATSLTRLGSQVRVDGVQSGGAPSEAALRALLERLSSPHRGALLVSEEARLSVRHGPGARRSAHDPEHDGLARGFVLCGGGSPERCLVATVARERRLLWSAALARLGLRLEGIYPLLGSALAGIEQDASARPRLVLQLERRWIALLEEQGARCLDALVLEESPSVARCAALIGEGCPEVALCGGGVDLSAFGYELVRDGRTWARLPAVLCLGGPARTSLAAAVGAARHALGLAAVDAVACVPALDG